MTDSIADLLVRIKNAEAVSKKEVILPYSKMVFVVAKILCAEGYLSQVERKKEENKVQDSLILGLKYSGSGEGVIHGMKRISKPGQRIYASSKRLPKVLQGLGISIVTTSQGVMTDSEARKRHLGGEVICKVW